MDAHKKNIETAIFSPQERTREMLTAPHTTDKKDTNKIKLNTN